jgi:hypothetical protein
MDNLLIKITKMINEKSTMTNTTAMTTSAIVSSALTPQMERLIEDAFLGVTGGLLGTMCILLNFIDERSSKSWKGVKIRYLGNPPIVGDILAISSFTFFVVVMEYYGGGIKAQFLWWLVTLASTVFPAAVLSLSHHAARTVSDSFVPTAANMISMARSVEPILFGLRYGLLTTYFGMAACLDAIVIVGLLPRNTRDRYLKDCFVGQLPSHLCVLFLGAKLSVWGYDFIQVYSAAATTTTGSLGTDLLSSPSLTITISAVVDSFLAAGILRIMNFAVFVLYGLGVNLANAIATSSRGCVRPDGSVTKDYNNWGILVFGAWTVSILILLQL